MDLGSGDGRNVIAAGKRGARAMGVEYNPDLVELSRQKAKEAGVSDKVTFVQGDMYEADISKASVMALFLLPSNLEKLKDKLLALKPGSRIVMNTFTVEGWEADVTERLENNCESWCTALLHIVPAKVAGTWQFEGGELALSPGIPDAPGHAHHRWHGRADQRGQDEGRRDHVLVRRQTSTAARWTATASPAPSPAPAAPSRRGRRPGDDRPDLSTRRSRSARRETKHTKKSLENLDHQGLPQEFLRALRPLRVASCPSC